MASPDANFDWTRIGPLIAAAAAFVVACFAALFTYLNSEIQKFLKRRDIYRLLKAEITNLERHCRIASYEICQYEMPDIAAVKMTKYKDGNMLLLDTKEIYLLNDNVCQDVMYLFVMSRNNDICIDELVAGMRAEKIKADALSKRIDLISERLKDTADVSRHVLSNLAEYIKRPRSYRRPAIKQDYKVG